MTWSELELLSCDPHCDPGVELEQCEHCPADPLLLLLSAAGCWGGAGIIGCKIKC